MVHTVIWIGIRAFRVTFKKVHDPPKKKSPYGLIQKCFFSHAWCRDVQMGRHWAGPKVGRLFYRAGRVGKVGWAGSDRAGPFNFKSAWAGPPREIFLALLCIENIFKIEVGRPGRADSRISCGSGRAVSKLNGRAGLGRLF